ncbi:MAG: hypothetical protein KGP28_11160 [Bdellovibrionales bacterium]|nr:hypothetical protein [Bdellovibrionales bacterium]
MIFAVLPILFSLTLPVIALASNEARISGMNSEELGTLTGSDRFSGTVGFDSSSFFYRSESRGTAATTLNATLRVKSDSKILHAEGDLSAYTFVTNTPAIGVESREMYIQTRRGALGNFDISVGRKLEDWSRLDGTWRMMSLWSPRWTWDELHPQVIGMTGLFIGYRTKNFKAVFFGSPIAIPERGTPVEEKDNNIISPNPFWKPLPSEITVLGAQTRVNYSLLMPSIQQILLRPNFALKARYEFDGGAFFSLNSGVLPVHMVQMAAEPFLATSGPSGRLDVNIRPQFPMRNINTIELGYDSPTKDWNLWLSGSYEQPFRFQNGETWLNPIITPSTILSAGTSVDLTSNFRFNGSLLIINEQPFSRSSRVPDVNVQLPSRFPLKQGIQVGGNWKFSDINEGNINWVQDLIQQNHLISMDVSHWIRSARISIGAGMDVILANSTQGWVGNYYGDDRLRGWLKYAF